MDDKEIKKELEFLSPLLNQWQQERINRIPEGYFDELHQKVLAKTVEKSRKRRFSYRVYKYAAAIVALAGIAWLLSYYSGGEANTSNDVIAQTEALDYIEENISDFSQDELAGLFMEEEPDNLQDDASSPGLPEQTFDSLSKEKL